MTAPYGSWTSPLTAARAMAGATRLSEIAVDGEDVYWLEGRPAEGGRNVLVRQSPGQMPFDVLPDTFNVRSRVHEYGGAAYAVHRGTIYASNLADQRLYAFAPDAMPRALTPPGYYYAQCQIDASRRDTRLVCVREDHTAAHAKQPAAAIVAISMTAPSAGQVLIGGADFYSDPVISPDGQRLAWLQWHHPNMPWDGTELCVATLDSAGVPSSSSSPVRVAGGPEESIFQPRWSPDGLLYFVSDRSGWWNLYRRERDGRIEALLPCSAEFGKPQWGFGTTTYGFESAERLIVSWVEDGRWQLGRLTLASPDRQALLEPIALPLDPVDSLIASSRAVYFIGASTTAGPAITCVALEDDAQHCQARILRRATATNDALDARYISQPRAIRFESSGVGARSARIDGSDRTDAAREQTHAFYYPPTNPDFEAPAGTRPPLIVISHGGPTGATLPIYRADIQFWTTRGFAVVDVNYGGSTGYGRAYRQRLDRQWGIVDVRDAVAAAQHLVAAGLADPERLITRGSSAGGYTTLAALTFFPETFKAGASYYGISDLEVLAQDTHKFESRYLDSLIGPYPAAKSIYRERSPIHFVDGLDCALILLQGLEDKVVPPSQSQMMADAVRKKGLPVAYVAFEGEQHGFRKAENLVRALEAELYFYGRVFGFEPADALAPVAIENLAARD